MDRELQALLSKRSYDLSEWLIGNIPKHYKRISISTDEAIRLAKIGASAIGAYFGDRLYFTQAVIAGAVLEGKYKEYVIVTPSQYGKSWLFGRVGLLLGYNGEPTLIAGASADTADIIMSNVIGAVQSAAPEIQNKLTTSRDQIERLAVSLSKSRIGFSNGGYVQPISLADTYADNKKRNKAVGRGANYLLDEAALVKDDTFAELGRREFATVGEESYKMVMISNPHNPGFFYEKLTDDNPPDDTLIIWMDILTAIEEGRWTEQKVTQSEFAKHRKTRREYLLCVLDRDGGSMFEKPKLYQPPFRGDYVQYFLGIDAAYKGKDNISIALNAVSEDGRCHIEEVVTVDKGEWVDGVTSEQIIDDISRIIRKYRVTLTCVDIGYGVWLVEGLAKRGFAVKGINFGEAPTKGRVKANQYAAKNAQNKRAEMHLDLQDLIENQYIEFSEQAYEAVKDVFPYVTSERKANGKIQIIKKSEIKAQIGKSPDELDSILLSVHAPLIFGAEIF